MNLSTTKKIAAMAGLLLIFSIFSMPRSVSASTYYYYKAVRTSVWYSTGHVTYYVVWVEWAQYPGQTLSYTPKYIVGKVNYWWTFLDEYYFQCLLYNMDRSPWSYLEPAAVAGYCSNNPAGYFLMYLGILSSFDI